jgi:hypothetical protein
MLSAQALGDFEEDHFIPLAVGGSPRSPKNLWPEPYEGKFGGVSQLEGCLQALRPLSGRGKTSGLEIGQLRAKGATLFHSAAAR